MSLPTAESPRPTFDPKERRVLGVLVEKAKTTPEQYPLTLAALVTGCNQKSNRDPVTNYDGDDVEEILHGLRRKGAVIMVESGGRVVRWKHTLYDGLKVNKVELAVLTELLLRGPQTEGELRARASRMEPLADLAALQGVLEPLEARGLVVALTPGRTRGVYVTHGLYPAPELDRIRQAYLSGAAGAEPHDEPARPGRATLEGPGVQGDLEALRADLASLRETVETLAAEVHRLKAELGA